VNPVGTGPFKLVEWKRDAHIKLVKFDGYWQKGKPYLDGIDTRALSRKNQKGGYSKILLHDFNHLVWSNPIPFCILKSLSFRTSPASGHAF
jgi:hypothetical protein